MDVSIITPVFNGATTIQACIDSVLSQEGVTVEHIVEDGASKDNTVALLEAINDSKLIWHSAPDNGVYNGMNRGLKRAKGKWVLFLGSNDNLVGPTVLKQALDAANDSAQILLGHAQYDSGAYWKSKLDKSIIARNTVHHQGTLYQRQLFDNRPFNDTLKVYGDYDHNLHLFHQNTPQQQIDVLLSQCENDGLSDTPRLKYYWEQIQIRHRYYPFYKTLPYDALTLARYSAKKLLRR